VLEPDQEVDVGEPPGPPGQPSGEPDPAEVDDRRLAADGGDVARVAVAEGRRRLTPQPRLDRPRRVTPALLGGVADSGHLTAIGIGDADRVPHREDLRAAWHREVLQHLDTPGLV